MRPRWLARLRSSAYRDDKAGTTLDLLPDLLAGQAGPGLRVRVGDTVLTGPLAVLVSNNPYSSDGITGVGRRPRLDRGVLGVLAVTMRGDAR